MSSYPPELWTWTNCKDKIISLQGRLGFDNETQMSILGYKVDLTNGSIYDNILNTPLDHANRQHRLLSNTIFYVLSAYSDSPEKTPSGKLISSKQFRGAQFTERDTMGERFRLSRQFKETSSLENSVNVLKGSVTEFPYGDIAVSLTPLPHIPIVFVLSLADGEFPADTRIFYDETIENYLDSEQTYFLTSMTVSRLIQVSLL